MSLAGDVAAFARRCAAFAASLAAVETALGLAAPPPYALPSLPADAPGGIAASAVDLAAASTMLATFAEALDALERRVGNLAAALALFARVPAPHAPAVPLPEPDGERAGDDDRLSRIALDGLQKQLVASEDRLAGFELRVGAAEDAVDAFFGTVAS